MKKLQKIIVLGLTCLTVSSAVSMVGCDDKHTHQYKSQVITPTCQSEGCTKYTCSCGNFYTENPTNIIDHSGTGTCSMCQLDYYEELKQLIISNGSQYNDRYYYEGATRTSTDTYQDTFVCFDPSDYTIYMACSYKYALSSAVVLPFNFLISIPHPSEDAAIKTGIYDWYIYVPYEQYEASYSGTINGNTFSSTTTSLPMTSYYDNISALAANLAKATLIDAFIPLLKMSQKHIKPSNYGFVNYNLDN